MAIECISREDAQNITASWLSTYITEEQREAVESIEALLGELPAADVRPVVRGRWVHSNDEEFSQPHVYCSNCGEYYFAWYRKFPFCPNCGADMRGKCND